MKRKNILSWLLILSLVLAAGSAAALAADNPTGTFYLTDMSDGSGQDYKALLAVAAKMGKYATLEIKEDGAATMDLMDEVHEFRFDFGKKQAIINDKAMDYTYEDDVLSFGMEDMYMTFSRDMPKAESNSGVFDYYVMDRLLDENGKELELAPTVKAEIYLFADGSALLRKSDRGASVEVNVQFDQETGKVIAEIEDVDDDECLFRIEDKELILYENGQELIFKLSDPGWAGPYQVVSMKQDDGTDLSEELAMLEAMGLAPTLEIQEDGKAILTFVGQELEMVFDFEKMVVTSPEEEVAEGEPTSVPFTYEMGRLTMERGGASMTFGRAMKTAEKEADAEVEAKK